MMSPMCLFGASSLRAAPERRPAWPIVVLAEYDVTFEGSAAWETTSKSFATE